MADSDYEQARAKVGKCSDETLRKKLVTQGFSKDEVDTWARVRLINESLHQAGHFKPIPVSAVTTSVSSVTQLVSSAVTTTISSTGIPSLTQSALTSPVVDINALFQFMIQQQQQAEERREREGRQEREKREEEYRRREEERQQREEERHRKEQERYQQERHDAEKRQADLIESLLHRREDSGNSRERVDRASEDRVVLIKRYGEVLKLTLMKMPNENSQIPLWLDTMEEIMNTFEVPNNIRHALLLPSLNDKAKRVVCKMSEETKIDFALFKAALSKEFSIYTRTEIQTVFNIQTYNKHLYYPGDFNNKIYKVDYYPKP